MNSDNLKNLTMVIDNINDENNITDEFLHEKIWDSMNMLRNDPNKDELISEWKYREDFICTENRHLNGEKFFLTHWEKSYVMYFYMCIYH
jgi:hypothetical protein